MPRTVDEIRRYLAGLPKHRRADMRVLLARIDELEAERQAAQGQPRQDPGGRRVAGAPVGSRES